MELFQNLLIIAGTGNKSGKTAMACKIIESFPDLQITAIKITPHFHELTEGLLAISESNRFLIYEETNRNSAKDTSRMLRAGARKVYFAKVYDDSLYDAFLNIIESIPAGTPVICESPALRNFVEPGAFIIMTSTTLYNKKNLKHLENLPHLLIKLEDLAQNPILPVRFEYGKWCMKFGVS